MNVRSALIRKIIFAKMIFAYFPLMNRLTCPETIFHSSLLIRYNESDLTFITLFRCRSFNYRTHTHMRHIFLPFILAVASAGMMTAQESADSARIYFRQGDAEVNLGLNGNRINITPILSTIRRGAVPRTVNVVGAASPEGSTTINASLSQRRADAIFSLLSDSVAIPEDITGFTFIGRDWKGLREMVENDPDVPSRQEVLSLLDSIISAIDSGESDNEANLTALRGIGAGRPYAYMYRNMFPTLRTSRLYITYTPSLTPVPTTPSLLTLPSSVIPAAHLSITPAEAHKPFYMALKTNMLYDALAIPSISAEFYLGKNWSLVANWMYGWWDNDHRHRYWRAYGGDLAVRRWFGAKAKEKPLTGHHLGVYAGVVTYDFEFGGKGWMGGIPGGTLWDRCNTVAGIEYGYSLPIARRLNIDFTIGVGYMGGKLVDYVPGDGFYLWKKTRHLNWFGPTKAEISLVWLIGRGNYNAKKGGLK